MDFNVSFLGIRLFIWVIMAFAMLVFIFSILYWNREKIREHLLKLRNPEKAIRISIIYPSGIFSVYWRVIPIEEKWDIDGKVYFYNPDRLLKNKENKFPNQHFFYDNPLAIDYSHYTGDIRFSGNELDIYRENDLKRKLINLDAEKMTMMILMIISGATLMGVIFIISKMMGWIK